MEREEKQRVAMNEATFRKVNEGMEAGQDDSGLLTFVCECGRLKCTRLIHLDPWRSTRGDIVERHDRYLVVDRPDFDQGLRQLGGRRPAPGSDAPARARRLGRGRRAAVSGRP